MNSTSSSDWNTNFRQSFDGLHPSVISLPSNTHIHDILVVIGFITVCLLLFVLMVQCLIKVRQIYRTSEPDERSKKSSKYKLRYPSYQKLFDEDNHPCKCFQYSCLPKFQCIQATCQISNRNPDYEEIDERQRNNSIYRVYPSRHISCVRIHTIK
jgi:hypothetical protein